MHQKRANKRRGMLLMGSAYCRTRNDGRLSQPFECQSRRLHAEAAGHILGGCGGMLPDDLVTAPLRAHNSCSPATGDVLHASGGANHSEFAVDN